ncbi:GNAT family N-acetyltransferase [Streptomyces sp. NPDC102406]|uniref:GNAT family N-acetyltransferase n=1 Tax=Streptomyces sp. NPDC102406 TaxID=3366171 RepID=UPI003825B2C3
MGGSTTALPRTAAQDMFADPAETRAGRLPDGAATWTRLADADDLSAVNALHSRCSRQSLTSRYLTGRGRLSAREWRALISPSAGFSWVTHPADDPGRIIAVTHVLRTEGTPGLRPAREPGTGAVELALLIDDAWQSRGLGSALARQAVAVARQCGHSAVHALLMADNRPALALAHALGAVVTPQGSQCTVELSLTRHARTTTRLPSTATAGAGVGVGVGVRVTSVG